MHRADVEIEQGAGHPVDRRRHRLDLVRGRDRSGDPRVELGVEDGIGLRGGGTGEQQGRGGDIRSLIMKGLLKRAVLRGAKTPSARFGCLFAPAR